MGTGPFAVPSFEAIRNGPHSIAAVVTRPLPPVKSRGGPPPQPVADWAAAHPLPVLRPDSINDDATVDALARLRPDLLVVCDYGQILKPAALSTARLGGINLHGSLLPAYRGAAPVQRAVLSGDNETGVTVIHMTPKLDGGPSLATRVTPIRPRETAGELEQRLSELGVDAVLDSIEVLRTWDETSPIGEIQDATRVSKAPRLSKSEAQIDWSRSSRLIDCHVRGMQPWPVAYTFYDASPGGSGGASPVRVQIKAVTIVDPDSVAADTATADAVGHAAPGQLILGDGLLVATGDGVVRIDALQPAGKKPMSGEAFVNGYQPNASARFVSAPDDAKS